MRVPQSEQLIGFGAREIALHSDPQQRRRAITEDVNTGRGIQLQRHHLVLLLAYRLR